MSARQLGTVGMAGVVFWVASVVALHFLDSDVDAANTYVSDYAYSESVGSFSGDGQDQAVGVWVAASSSAY
jgi:hypothetical protein